MKSKLIKFNNNLVDGLSILCFIYEFAKIFQLYLNTYFIELFIACFMLGIYFSNKKYLTTERNKYGRK